MDTTQDEALTLDVVKSYMQKRYTLVYIDYRDNLDEQMKELQECIHQQDWSPIDEYLFEGDWMWDSECQSIDYIIKELIEEISKDLELDEEFVENFFEENKDDIEETIRDRDDSTVLKDLLRNTSDPVMFYDTGIYIDSTEYDSKKEVIAKVREVKRALKIPANEKKYDDRIFVMLCQASYGGRLVIYFRHDLEDLIAPADVNRITFKDAFIAVIDNYNGSGDHTDLEGHEFSLPFEPKNIFIDKTLKYNYTHDVCGMYDSWCDGTILKFWKQKMGRKPKVKSSSLNAQMDEEKRLTEIYNSGKCTFGDMDMRRHHHTIYINDFPCGTHCKDCGTFWID